MSEFACIDFDEVHEYDDKEATKFIIDGKDYWIPDSQIDRIYYKTKKVYMEWWIARKKGLAL